MPFLNIKFVYRVAGNVLLRNDMICSNWELLESGEAAIVQKGWLCRLERHCDSLSNMLLNLTHPLPHTQSEETLEKMQTSQRTNIDLQLTTNSLGKDNLNSFGEKSPKYFGEEKLEIVSDLSAQNNFGPTK